MEAPTFEQVVADKDALARFVFAAHRATRPPNRKRQPHGAAAGDFLAELHRSAAITAWHEHVGPYAAALAAETSARNAFAAERTPERRKALKHAIQARETAETSATAWWDEQQGHLGEAAARAAGPKPPQAPRVTAVMFTN